MALEGVTKRTEYHGYSIGIIFTRTKDGKLVRITAQGRGKLLDLD